MASKEHTNTFFLIFTLVFIGLCLCINLPSPQDITKERIGIKLEKLRYPNVFRGLVSMREYLSLFVALRNILVNNDNMRRMASDISLHFGFFLSRVYLRKVIRDCQNMTTEQANYIYYLMNDFNKQREYNHEKLILDTDKDYLDSSGYTATHRLVDEEYWLENLAEQSVVNLNPFVINDTEGIFVDYERYQRLLNYTTYNQWDRFNESVVQKFMTGSKIDAKNILYKNFTERDYKINPYYEDYDMNDVVITYHDCLQFSLKYYAKDEGLKQRRDRATFPTCVLMSNTCLDLIENGKYWGLEQVLRLEFLVMAKYVFRCTVFSPESDQELLDQICSYAFNEGYFTSFFNDTINIDTTKLLLSRIMYCMVEGHAIFMQRNWITNFLKFQTNTGCFAYNMKKTLTVQEAEVNKNIPDFQQFYNRYLYGKGLCDGELTGIIAPVLAASIRFIMDTYT